jgi:hypothetical protein
MELLGKFREVVIDHDKVIQLFPQACLGLVFGGLLEGKEKGKVRFVDVAFGEGWQLNI